MEEVVFEVKGSSPEPYGIVFVKRSSENMSAYCSCPAGENGQYCKHRFSILDGKTDAIVSANIEEVEKVRSWLPGTDLDQAINNMKKLEIEAAKINKELSAAKKAVARAMRD